MAGRCRAGRARKRHDQAQIVAYERCMSSRTIQRAIAQQQMAGRRRQARWNNACARELATRAERERRMKAVEWYLEMCDLLAAETPAGYLRDVYRDRAYWALRDLRCTIR